MLNFEVPAGVLAELVPAGTELDLWQGRALVSVVGFRFLDTRVLGVPIPLHRDFDEVNLRFYVRRQGPEGWRRGVVFVKEIVPRRAIAWVARTVYNENYVALPMAHEVRLPGAQEPVGSVAYSWGGGDTWTRLAAVVAGEPTLPAAGSEPEFIAEHYWGYARQRDGGTVEYQVEHPPWAVWMASQPVLEGPLATHYGAGFASFLRAPPVSAFVAVGSPVVVRRGRRLA